MLVLDQKMEVTRMHKSKPQKSKPISKHRRPK
jgi:hypothetical protein